MCLESNNDHSDLQVSLLLQLGQHSCAEEDLTLTNPVQVGVQVQMLDLNRHEVGKKLSLSDKTSVLAVTLQIISSRKGFQSDVYHDAAGLFAIHETFGDSTCSQDLITKSQGRGGEHLNGLLRQFQCTL